MTPKKRTAVRQNPQVTAERIAGETCPRHGVYQPDRWATDLHRQAVGGGVPPEKARNWMDRAAQIRRRCPECDGPHPTLLEWAVAIRRAATRERRHRVVTTVFVMPDRATADPEAYGAAQ